MTRLEGLANCSSTIERYCQTKRSPNTIQLPGKLTGHAGEIVATANQLLCGEAQRFSPKVACSPSLLQKVACRRLGAGCIIHP
jgi:hypothetical protein